MLAVGIVWSVFTLIGVLLLIKPVNRRILEWEAKRKPGCSTPNYPQRIVFLLLTMLMMAVSFSSAFHCDLRSTIGISSGMAVCLMIILPALYFALGLRKKHH